MQSFIFDAYNFQWASVPLEYDILRVCFWNLVGTAHCTPATLRVWRSLLRPNIGQQVTASSYSDKFWVVWGLEIVYDDSWKSYCRFWRIVYTILLSHVSIYSRGFTANKNNAVHPNFCLESLQMLHFRIREVRELLQLGLKNALSWATLHLRQ